MEYTTGGETKTQAWLRMAVRGAGKFIKKDKYGNETVICETTNSTF